jgi:anti-sigma B factor antagonist
VKFQDDPDGLIAVGTTPGEPDEPGFRLSISRLGGRRIVAALGELDLATVEAFSTGLREQLAAGPVLLDLSRLAFMDSSGVRALDALLRDAGQEGWTLTIRANLHENVRQVLEMTGMIDRLPLGGAGPRDRR